MNTLSTSMKNPTTIAVRGLDELTWYMLGTGQVYQELCLDPHAETYKVSVDSDWADDKETRQISSEGAVLCH